MAVSRWGFVMQGSLLYGVRRLRPSRAKCGSILARRDIEATLCSEHTFGTLATQSQWVRRHRAYWKGETPVGRNEDIKRFDARSTGQSADLFDCPKGAVPVVTELLSTSWVGRASDLPSGDSSGKRADIAVEVEWDGERGRPAAFRYKRARRAVDDVVMQWAVEHDWWDPTRSVSRRCFRVVAGGGVWDLAFDREHEKWFLIGVVD